MKAGRRPAADPGDAGRGPKQARRRPRRRVASESRSSGLIARSLDPAHQHEDENDDEDQRIRQIIPYFSGFLSLLATILLPNAASMIWAARSSVPWIRWPYTLSVIVGELCP